MGIAFYLPVCLLYSDTRESKLCIIKYYAMNTVVSSVQMYSNTDVRMDDNEVASNILMTGSGS
jgi:hypothetical protein